MILLYALLLIGSRHRRIIGTLINIFYWICHSRKFFFYLSFKVIF